MGLRRRVQDQGRQALDRDVGLLSRLRARVRRQVLPGAPGRRVRRQGHGPRLRRVRRDGQDLLEEAQVLGDTTTTPHDDHHHHHHLRTRATPRPPRPDHPTYELAPRRDHHDPTTPPTNSRHAATTTTPPTNSRHAATTTIPTSSYHDHDHART